MVPHTLAYPAMSTLALEWNPEPCLLFWNVQLFNKHMGVVILGSCSCSRPALLNNLIQGLVIVDEMSLTLLQYGENPALPMVLVARC